MMVQFIFVYFHSAETGADYGNIKPGEQTDSAAAFAHVHISGTNRALILKAVSLPRPLHGLPAMVNEVRWP